jgi:hypothetical protein
VDLHNLCKTDDTISNESGAVSYFCKFFIKYVATESEGSFVPCCYYTKGVANYGGRFLGFGDFAVFNVLLLILLSLFPSTEVKVWIAFGFIISIIIGQLSTCYLQQLWNLRGMPALPLPVICFSTYVLLLDFLMTFSDECAGL